MTETTESGAPVAVDAPVSDNDNYVESGNTAETIIEKAAEEPVEKVEEPSGDEAKKLKRGGFQRKLERQTAELAAKDAEIARLRALAEGEKPAPNPSEKPIRENYQSDVEWIEALTDFKTDQKFKQQAESEKKQTVAKTWNEKVEAARAVYPDYDEAIAEYDDTPVRQDILDAMLESDLGVDVSYYLANHPEELEAINKDGVSATKIGKEIARIESIINGNKTESKAAVKVTNAPPPIAPVKAKASTVNKSLEDADYDEYRRLRGYN